LTSQRPDTYPAHAPEGSGAQALIGYDIDLNDPAGGAVVRLVVDTQHLNRNGTLQGGIQSMMLDAAAGFSASRFLAGQDPVITPVVTLSLTAQYLAPAHMGLVVATGYVTGGGYKIVYASAEIRDAQGLLLSQGQGVFKRTQI